MRHDLKPALGLAMVALVALAAVAAVAADKAPPTPPAAPASKDKPAAPPAAPPAATEDARPLWSKRCLKAGDSGQEACFVEQYAIAMPDKTVLLNVLFGFLGPEGKPRVIITAPLGMLLIPGLVVAIDGGKPMTMPLESCNAGGCRTVVDMDPSSLDSFRRGSKMQVRYVNAERKTVEIPIDLKGLSAALAQLKP